VLQKCVTVIQTEYVTFLVRLSVLFHDELLSAVS